MHIMFRRRKILLRSTLKFGKRQGDQQKGQIPRSDFRKQGVTQLAHAQHTAHAVLTSTPSILNPSTN